MELKRAGSQPSVNGPAAWFTGTARIVRGDFDFAGKRFQFDERGSVKLSTRPEDIVLDLRPPSIVSASQAAQSSSESGSSMETIG